jgi:ABC-type oligopeptide transport system ATPase subunit
MGHAVEADQLVKHYGGRGGAVEAVRGVDLHVESGEVFGFLGPNGAGKSTTVRMLTTLMTITSGTARVAGVDVTADPDAVRMRIGVALQEAILNAIDHGNLEVSSDLRQQDEAVFSDLIKLRREQPPYQGRRVHFDVKISAREARYTIRDDGPGFDVKALPDPGATENLEKMGGRGLLLIRTFMDEVWHNDRGNTITMVKRHEI